MTRIVKGLGAATAVVLMAGPMIGLGLATIAEIGPTGGVRASVVGWGLTLSDPFVARCLWNSASVSIVAVGAGTVVGVAIARVVQSLLGWRLGVARTLVRLAAGCHPMFGAIGYLLLAPRLAGLSAGRLDAVARWDEEAWQWIGLGLAQFGFASAWVAWWAGRSLGRIRAEWRLIAAMSGASRSRIWRTTAWPLVRPAAARAAASAFAVLLIEPGGPIVLGLNRTLGAQIVASTWMSSRADWPRAATLSAIGLVVALSARWLAARWGGADVLDPVDSSGPRPPASIAPAGRLAGVVSLIAFGGWSLLCLTPALAIFGSLVSSGEAGNPADLLGGLALPSGSAVALGAIVAAVAMLMAWPLSATRRPRGVEATFDAVPPLAIGVGLFGLWQVLRAVGSSASTDLGAIEAVRWLDPYQSPWLLVSWGTALAHLPWAVDSARQARRIDARALQDLARMSGDRRARSRTLLLAPIGFRRCLGPTVGLIMLAASGLSPAVVLSPLETFRPIGAWIVREPGPGIEALPWLAASGLVLQMVGLCLLLGSDRAGTPIRVARG